MRRDLSDMHVEIKKEVGEFKAEVRRDLSDVRAEMRHLRRVTYATFGGVLMVFVRTFFPM